MPITPIGTPPWARQSSHVNYGGNVNKRNYMGAGVVNALTDVGAEAICRMASDLAAICRTAPVFVITYLCNDTSPAAPTIEIVNGMTGVRIVGYAGNAAPSGLPSAARNGNGDVTFTFAASYSDDYGVSAPWLPRTAEGGLHGSTGGAATCEISGSTVRVRAVSHAGAAVSDARVTLEVG